MGVPTGGQKPPGIPGIHKLFHHGKVAICSAGGDTQHAIHKIHLVIIKRVRDLL